MTESDITAQLQDAGYESHNPLQNLNTIAVVMLLIQVQFILGIVYQ